MKVKILTAICFTNHQNYQRGHIVDLTPKVAKELIKANFAEKYVEKEVPKTEVKQEAKEDDKNEEEC